MRKRYPMEKIPVCLMVIFSLCSFGAIPNAFSEESHFHEVSMIHLIANPKKYRYKKIAVKGYYTEARNGHLFLSKDHADIMDIKSGFPVLDSRNVNNAQSSAACSGHYVEMRGEFVSFKDWERYSIIDLERVLILKQNKECWKVRKR